MSESSAEASEADRAEQQLPVDDEEMGPAVVRLLTRRVMGAGPEPASAADAWRRIDAFFGEHLAG